MSETSANDEVGAEAAEGPGAPRAPASEVPELVSEDEALSEALESEGECEAAAEGASASEAPDDVASEGEAPADEAVSEAPELESEGEAAAEEASRSEAPDVAREGEISDEEAASASEAAGGVSEGEPAPPASPLIVVERFQLGGSGGRPPLSLPHFALWPGVTGVVGPSGVGKTVLCEVLLGLQRGRGRVRVLGHELPKAGPRVRSEVGYLPQDLAIYPGMTALEFSNFVGEAQARWRAKKVFERLARYQVPTRVPVERLGPRPRAFLAMALALGSEPRLAIVDLPTSLDGGGRADLLEALLAERGETSLLIATARPHELEGRCREVLLLGGASAETCLGPELARGLWRLDLRDDARPPLDPRLTCLQAGPGPSGARWIVAGEEGLLPSDPALVSSLRPATYEEAALARIAQLAARQPTR